MLDQLFVFAIVLVSLVFFILGRPRFDLVGIFTLISVILLGLIPAPLALASFGHPAVIIVASMFVLGQVLTNAGLADIFIRKLGILGNHPILQLSALSIVVALLSAFVNNAGALALILPVAIHFARVNRHSPAIFLLPLAFASHLGGYLTLIGTPRNLIVSSFREEFFGTPFRMFDFLPVGIIVALIGLTFLIFLGWRLLPKRRGELLPELPAHLQSYVAELLVNENSPFVGQYVRDLSSIAKSQFEVNSVIRDGRPLPDFSELELIKEEDIILIEAKPEVITALTETRKLTLLGRKSVEARIDEADEIGTVEAVIAPTSSLVGNQWSRIDWRSRFGVNLFAIARSEEKITVPLGKVALKSGDILLLQGRKDSILKTLTRFSCLSLVDRGLTVGRPRQLLLALSIFTVAIVMASFGWASVAPLFLTAATLCVLLGLISVRQAYASIDWPVLIMIASMIALGEAFLASGSAETISVWATQLGETSNPVVVLGVVLVVSMLLADFVNTTAAAVLMSPVAIVVAQSIAASPDPFLIAVAIGASSAYLTPVSHESNTMVLVPGGYHFTDYLRLGLPLEIIIAAVSLPLIIHFWPF